MSMPVIKLRQAVQFPAGVQATTGINVEKSNGIYTFETDWTDFAALSVVPASPTNYVLTFDSATGIYARVPSSLLGGAVAGIADVTTPGVYVRQTGSWVPLTSVTVSIVDFGAVGDVVTDNTSAINAAVNSGASVVTVPDGFFSTSLVHIPSNVTLTGTGTIRRIDNDIEIEALLAIDSSHDVILDGISIDGNSANNTTTCFFLVGGGDTAQTTIRNCKIFSNKGDAIRLGNTADHSDITPSLIENNTIAANEGCGVSVSNGWNVSIINNMIKSNLQDGVIFQNFVFPPVADVANQIVITGNRVLDNSGSGISFGGFYIGGTPDKPISGHTVPQSRAVTISNNIVDGSGRYGIGVSGRNIAITGNTLRRNGVLVDTGPGGGILAIMYGGIVSDNSISEFYYWGIDIGAAQNVIISNNYIGLPQPGVTAGAVGVNFGASVNCSIIGNVFDRVYNVSGVGTCIQGTGNDFGGSWFETVGRDCTIANNKMFSAMSGPVGINLYDGMDQIQVIGNSASGFAAGYSYILQGGQVFFALVERNNVDWDAGNIPQIVVSGSDWVISDVGDYFAVLPGTAAPANIYTQSQNQWLHKVRQIVMTNQGSGYNSASPPTVSFSGGGGTGAAGTACVTNSGIVIGVTITNPGTGYTSAPTVSFSGGGAAAGNAIVGCNNSSGRKITFLILGTLTYSTTGNVRLTSTFSAVGSGATLGLVGSFENWYETARSP